jgi:hypothetical protein
MDKKIVAFFRLLAVVWVLVLSAQSADAQTTYYSRSPGGNWNSAATWSTVAYDDPTNTGTFPVAGDIVFIGGASSIVTITATAACATLDIDNNSTLNVGQAFTVSGSTTVGSGSSGVLAITSVAGAKVFGGLVFIDNGALWNEVVNEAITFQGGITNNGTFTAGTGNHTFNTNSQVLTGNFTIPNITVTGGAVTLTNTNTLTVNTALSGSGRITQGSNAVLNIGGTSGITNMTAAASGNTVNYTGPGQTVKNVNYVNLGLSGSGVKTLQVGTTVVSGNFSLAGTVSTTGVIGLNIGSNLNIGTGTTFTSGAFAHSVAGDWTNNGSFNGLGGSIILNGSAQNISGGITTFNDLLLSGSGTKTFSVNTTISNELSIANGAIANLSNTNTYTSNALILAGALQGSGTWGSTSSSPPAANQNNTFFSGNGLITVANGGFTYYSIASADWSAPTTWSTTGFGGPAASSAPGAGDYVIIGDGRTVSITGTEECEDLLFDAGTAVTNSLLITSGSLTVAGVVTIPQTVTSGSNILNVGTGSLTAGDIDFTATSGGAGHQILISTGTATVSGNITGIGASSTIEFTGAGLLQVGGSIFTSANGTLTSAAGSTVEYTGAAQTVQALGYSNLTLSGIGTKTLAASATVGGNLTIGDGTTFTIGAFTFNVNGTTIVGGGTSGTLSFTGTAGTKTFTGLVTVNTGASWSNTANEGITLQGGITSNGTFIAGTGAYTFNTNSQVLTGTFTIPSVTVTGGAVVLTNTNSLTVNTSINGSGRITQGTGATLNIGGASTITNMTATAAGNTVNYTGTAQTVKNVNYENLGLAGSGIKTLQAGTTSINGDMILSGAVSVTGVIGLAIGGDVNIGIGSTFTSGALDHTLTGDWINNGSFIGTVGSSITFNGTAQSINGGSTTFNNLTLAGSGTKVFGVSTTIVGAFLINTGVVADLGAFTTHTANTLVLNGVLQSTTGTWGSSGSVATTTDDTFFLNTSSGVITIAVGGNNYYSIASTAWNVNTTWSNIGFGGAAAAGTPGPGDFVFIGGGFTVTVTNAATCNALSFDAGTSITNTLTINSGNSLSVSGAVTIPQTVTSGSNILDVGAGTLTAGDIDFTSTPAGAGHQLTISTGTATVNGNITGIGAGSTIQFSGAGLLQLGGSIFTSANGTLTSVAGSTVEYTGATQTVQALGYNNLTLSGSGTKTLTAATTVGGNLVVNNGVNFAIGAFTFAVTGTTSVNSGGTLSFTSTTGTKSFTGLVTVNTGGLWNETVNESITFEGGITNNGTFTAGTGIHTFFNTSQVLIGNFSIPNITVTGPSVVLTNTNILTVNNALNGTGQLTQGTGATLNIGGTSGITTLIATASGNTVNYTGTAQSVKNVNYENLGLSGSGIKTLQVGTTSITGDLILSGTVSVTGVIGLTIGGDVNIGVGTTFTSGTFDHNVAGDWINNGLFIGTVSGSINLNGAGPQNISGNSTTFYNLILSGSGNKVFGVTTTIADALSINLGAVADLGSITTHTANRLILNGVLQGTTNQTWGSTSSGANNQNNLYFLNPSIGLITIAVGGTNFYSRANTDWNTNTTWSNVGFGGVQAAGIPGPSDFVSIGGGFAVTVTGTQTCSSLSFDAGTSVTNTLTINSGSSLTVSGTLTIPQTVTSGSNILDVGAGTLTVGDLDFVTTTGGAGHQMSISTGTATVNGNLTTDVGSSTEIEFTGAGLLQLGGSFFSATNGTLTVVAGSTVQYNGLASQAIESHVYQNLVLSGNNTKTLSANATVSGNLSIGDGTTFNIGAAVLAVTGTTTVGAGTSGTLIISSTTGTKTFTGLVTVNTGALWNETVNESIVFQGGITNNGTFTAGTAAHTFTTNSQVLTGDFTIPNVSVTAPAVLSNTNTLTVNAALSGSGQLTQGTGAILNIGGTSTITNMTAIAAGNTVNYNGAAQTVKNVNYENLGLLGSGVKTLQVGTTSITGDLVLSGTVATTGVIGLTVGDDINIGSGTTFTSGAFTHNVGGDFINNGSFISGSGTVAFAGSSAQSISGSTVTDFNNISVTNSSVSPAVQVESNQNLIGILSLAAGSQFDADGSSNTAVFTLLSSGDAPTIDASIAALPTGASVIGNVTVQRYMAIEGGNNTRIYRYISSPVQSAPVSQIQSEIPVTGSFTGTSTCTGCGSSQSMFQYNESIITDTNGSGGNNVDDGYEDFPAASNSETFTSGRGYTIFVRGNIDPILSSGSARWDVRGTINSGTIDLTPFTTFTASGIPANDGWNLVGNPYPSTIDWDAVGWNKSGINNAIYLRDNGLISPVFATYSAGVGVNGGSRYIATGQAFFVQGDGSAINFQATESVKAAGTQTTFFREAAINDMVRVALEKGNITDETVIRFAPSASENFDPALDAYKLKNAVFNLSSVSNETQYAINALPKLDCSTSVSLDVSNAELGVYNLRFSEFESFDETMEIQLTDKYLEQTINISDQSDYQFEVTSDQNSQGERFTLVFSLAFVDVSILPEGPATLCGNASYSITLPTSESGVAYYASLNGTTISDNIVGTGNTLAIGIDEAKLALGENNILIYAKRATCDAVPLMEALAVTKDNIYQIQSTSGDTACQQGSVTLSASGAPENGSYHWYESLSVTEPIPGVSGKTFTTPLLDKTKTYYVTAVNAFGCEGERTEIKAEVIKYDEILITETTYGVLSSSYPAGNTWYVNDVLIPAAKSQTITVTESGVYRVEVAIGNCKTTDSYEFVVTGMEGKDAEIEIYPNPVLEELTIQGLRNVHAIELISNTGLLVKTQEVKVTSVTMDMKNYPSGLYLVKLLGANNSVSTFKVIKK